MEKCYAETHATHEKTRPFGWQHFKTIHDCIRIAGHLSQHIHRLNIQIKDLQLLKSSHIESYISVRLDSGITACKLQNEMAVLRNILAQAGREKFAHSERINNKALGLGNATGRTAPRTPDK